MATPMDTDDTDDITTELLNRKKSEAIDYFQRIVEDLNFKREYGTGKFKEMRNWEDNFKQFKQDWTGQGSASTNFRDFLVNNRVENKLKTADQEWLDLAYKKGLVFHRSYERAKNNFVHTQNELQENRKLLAGYEKDINAYYKVLDKNVQDDGDVQQNYAEVQIRINNGKNGLENKIRYDRRAMV